MSRVVSSLALVLAVAVSTQLALAGDCKYSKANKPKDIVDTAVAAGDFKNLAAALKALPRSAVLSDRPWSHRSLRCACEPEEVRP